jgi:hypothetical protein
VKLSKNDLKTIFQIEGMSDQRKSIELSKNYLLTKRLEHSISVNGYLETAINLFSARESIQLFKGCEVQLFFIPKLLNITNDNYLGKKIIKSEKIYITRKSAKVPVLTYAIQKYRDWDLLPNSLRIKSAFLRKDNDELACNNIFLLHSRFFHTTSIWSEAVTMLIFPFKKSFSNPFDNIILEVTVGEQKSLKFTWR